MKTLSNKKVLLREHKRHTARRVVTTHSVVLSWLTSPRLDLNPPCRLDLTAPLPAGPDPPPAGPDTPLSGRPAGPDSPRQLDLAPHPRPAGPDPPRWLDLTHPPNRLDLTHPLPPAGWTWPPPPASWTWPHPPWTDRRTDTCQNITFTSYYVRGR